MSLVVRSPDRRSSDRRCTDRRSIDRGTADRRSTDRRSTDRQDICFPQVRSARVVVVVLNWNGWQDTIECLTSLFRSDYNSYQIVVIDNGSEDESLTHLRRWADGAPPVEHAPIPYTSFPTPEAALGDAALPDTPLIFIRVPANLGYAGGNNIGLRYAVERSACDFVWLLNNDTIVSPGALSAKLEAAVIDPSIAIVGATVLTYQHPTIAQVMGGGRLIPPLGHDTQNGCGTKAEEARAYPLLLEHVVGASLFVRVAAVRDVGLMDETYFLYREETDWCIRMRLSNWNLCFCPSAVVWHKQGRSIGYKTPLHDYYAVRNMLLLLHKFHPAALPTATVWLFAKCIAPKVLRLQPRRLVAVLQAFRDFFRGVRGRVHTDEELLANRNSSRDTHRNAI